MVRDNLGPMFLGKWAKKGPGIHRLAHACNPLPPWLSGISLLAVLLMLKIDRSVSNTLEKIGTLFTCNTEALADSFTTCTGYSRMCAKAGNTAMLYQRHVSRLRI